MPRLFTADGIPHPEISLQEAIDRQLSWDVFLSHKSDDTNTALDLARRVQSNGLSVWVDVQDPNIHGDGPDLDQYIERIIARSFSLMAVVTDVTSESWWVPFEIGLAFELRRYLATYATWSVSLPSFLVKHPIVRDSNFALRNWCSDIKDLKQRVPQTTRLVLEGHSFLSSSRLAYMREMKRMSSKYG